MKSFTRRPKRWNRRLGPNATKNLASTQLSSYYSSDQVYLIHIVNSQYCVIHQLVQESVENRGIYYTAHDSWSVTGYQGLFCPLNKPFVNRLPRGVEQAVVAGCS